MRKATKAEIIAHYQNDGYEVRVDDDGHIEFRKDDGEWLEGRWVSEYRFDDETGVQLT